SFYFNDAEGIAKENSRRQYGGRISFSQTGLNDRLTLSSNLATNFSKANLLGGGEENLSKPFNVTQLHPFLMQTATSLKRKLTTTTTRCPGLPTVSMKETRQRFQGILG